MQSTKLYDSLLSSKGHMSLHNRRAHVRYDFQQEIESIFRHNSTDEIFKGIIRDISEAGLGLYVFSPLKKGQEITIKSDLRELHRRGIVCWCNELGDSIYSVGLMFV